MAVFYVQPANPLKAGVMISAFEGTKDVQAFLVLRQDRNFPVQDVHKLADSFVQALNGTGTMPQGLQTGGFALHFTPRLDRDALYLTYRRPEDSQTAEGGNSVNGLEFRIQPGISDETRRFITQRLSTPGVMQSMMAAIDMSGSDRAPARVTPSPTSSGMTP